MAHIFLSMNNVRNVNMHKLFAVLLYANEHAKEKQMKNAVIILIWLSKSPR